MLSKSTKMTSFSAESLYNLTPKGSENGSPQARIFPRLPHDASVSLFLILSLRTVLASRNCLWKEVGGGKVVVGLLSGGP